MIPKLGKVSQVNVREAWANIFAKPADTFDALRTDRASGRNLWAA